MLEQNGLLEHGKSLPIPNYRLSVSRPSTGISRESSFAERSTNCDPNWALCYTLNMPSTHVYLDADKKRWCSSTLHRADSRQTGDENQSPSINRGPSDSPPRAAELRILKTRSTSNLHACGNDRSRIRFSLDASTLPLPKEYDTMSRLVLAASDRCYRRRSVNLGNDLRGNN